MTSFSEDCFEEYVAPHESHTQCLLIRGATSQVSWIPSKFAARGKILNLKEDGQWSAGWKVQEVYGTMKSNRLPDPHHDIKHHLLNTGDVAKKRRK